MGVSLFVNAITVQIFMGARYGQNLHNGSLLCGFNVPVKGLTHIFGLKCHKICVCCGADPGPRLGACDAPRTPTLLGEKGELRDKMMGEKGL